MGEMTKVLDEGRREGARRFFIAGDLNTELGLMYTDEDEELQEANWPQCWHGIDADLVGSRRRRGWM